MKKLVVMCTMLVLLLVGYEVPAYAEYHVVHERDGVQVIMDDKSLFWNKDGSFNVILYQLKGDKKETSTCHFFYSNEFKGWYFADLSDPNVSMRVSAFELMKVVEIAEATRHK